MSALRSCGVMISPQYRLEHPILACSVLDSLRFDTLEPQGRGKGTNEGDGKGNEGWAAQSRYARKSRLVQQGGSVSCPCVTHFPGLIIHWSPLFFFLVIVRKGAIVEG